MVSDICEVSPDDHNVDERPEKYQLKLLHGPATPRIALKDYLYFVCNVLVRLSVNNIQGVPKKANFKVSKRFSKSYEKSLIKLSSEELLDLEPFWLKPFNEPQMQITLYNNI